jgi:hypothetical protein
LLCIKQLSLERSRIALSAEVSQQLVNGSLGCLGFMQRVDIPSFKVALLKLSHLADPEHNLSPTGCVPLRVTHLPSSL